jgi:hypothetical protein
MVFVLTVCFKLVNFFFLILLHFVPERSTVITPYIVQIMSICLTWIL